MLQALSHYHSVRFATWTYSELIKQKRTFRNNRINPKTDLFLGLAIGYFRLGFNESPDAMGITG